jgi:hypothetical protein
MLVAAPVFAQDNAAESSPPPAAAEEIGPRELSNFSLGGTVTRRAEPRAETPPPARPVPEAATRSASTASPATAPAAPRRISAAPKQASAGSSEPVANTLSARPSLRDAPAATAAAGALAPNLPAPLPPVEAASGLSPLPWIAALLALAAGAVIYFGRRQIRHRHAAAGVSDFFEAPEPQPAAPPLRRAPAPRPSQAKQPQPAPQGAVVSSLRPTPPTPGLVTSGLRPWIELELEPSQALVTDEQAAIAFDVTLFNSGSAPARDVAVEACLINAGQQQDVELSQFYTSDNRAKDKIPTVGPLSRITLKSAVRLPRSAVQEYEVEGRKLFMPMVAVNSRYRWSSGEGQSAASFLVGPAANDSGKLAPLRLDQGKRGWRSLAARRYEKGIRR